MKKVLLTGAAGRIGTSLRTYLGDRYAFRCLDTATIEDELDTIVGDVREPLTVQGAMDGMDAVIHLATAHPTGDRTWEEVRDTEIGGTYNVLEAARLAGVRQVIFASSGAASGWEQVRRGKRTSPHDPVHPTNLYGVGKAVGELLCRYYAEIHGMSIICLRIGAFQPDLPDRQKPNDDIGRGWCSPEDLAQLVQRSLEAERLGFQIFLAASETRGRLWDMDNAKRLVGYTPRHRIEDWEQTRRGPSRMIGGTAGRRYLVRAAVLEGPAAVDGLRRWLDAVDLDREHLDQIVYRLLPLVYHNLAGEGVAHPLMNRLKGVYRRAWLENQLALEELIPFLSELQAHRFRFILLDDLTSILRLYDGQGARRPYALDLLVHPEDVNAMLTHLQASGIWPKVGHGSRFLRVETPLEVWPPFAMDLTLTWRAFPNIQTHDEGLEAWKHASEVTLRGQPVSTLDLESHFVRSCHRTVGTKPDAAFFSLVDVAWMLGKQSDAIDWTRVVELARRNRRVLLVKETLEELQGIVTLPKAGELLRELRREPISPVERLDARFIDPYRRFPGFPQRILGRLLRYRRSIKVPGPLGFLRYVQFAWGAPRLLTLPRFFLRHLGIHWRRRSA